MSYCRMCEDSDVYVIATTGGWGVFSGGGNSIFFTHQQDCYDHLLKLRNRGTRVPQRALDRMLKELRK